MSGAKWIASDSMFPPLRRVRKGDAKLIAEAGPFRVTSQANGEFHITAKWAASIPKNCRVSPENYCHAHGGYHIGGVVTRMAVAAAIQAVLAAPRKGRNEG